MSPHATSANLALIFRDTGFLAEIEATARDNDPADHSAYRSHKQPLEMYAFLLQSFVSNLEKGTAAKANADSSSAPAPKKVPHRTPLLRTTLIVTLQKPGTKKAPTKSKKDDWSWIDAIPEVLAVMAKALRLRTQTIWQTTQERDNFVSSVVAILESTSF